MSKKYILINKTLYCGVLNQGNPKAAILPADTLLELDDAKPFHEAIIKELKGLKGNLIQKRLNPFTKKVEEDVRWVEELSEAKAKDVASNVVKYKAELLQERKKAGDITASSVKKK